MAAQVEQYLHEVLSPSLQNFNVPDQFCSVILQTVRTQMISLLRHWDEPAFRKAILLPGIEEGLFYQPAAKAEVKCFVTVTLRNSPLETIQSTACSKIGMKHAISSDAVKTLTSSAIRFFNPLNFNALCTQAKQDDSSDFYLEVADQHPAAWTALQALAMTSAKTVDYPAISFDKPFSIPALSVCAPSVESSIDHPSVFDAYSSEWDPALLRSLQNISADTYNGLAVDSFKIASRNFAKLMDILEFLLTHDHFFVSSNFYIQNGHVERRLKPLRAGHTAKEMEYNLSQLSGLGSFHRKVLKALSK